MFVAVGVPTSTSPHHGGVTAAAFDELIAIGEAADVAGWDFSWLQGRATEERPPWGYARLLGERLARARASLDIHAQAGTGAGALIRGRSLSPR